MQSNYTPHKTSGWLVYVPGVVLGKIIKEVTGHDISSAVHKVTEWADENNHHIVETIAAALKH